MARCLHACARVYELRVQPLDKERIKSWVMRQQALAKALITSYRDHKSRGHYHPTILDTAAPSSHYSLPLLPWGAEVREGRREQMEEVWMCILSEKRGFVSVQVASSEPSIKVRGHESRCAHRKSDIFQCTGINCILCYRLGATNVYSNGGSFAGCEGATARKTYFWSWCRTIRSVVMFSLCIWCF